MEDIFIKSIKIEKVRHLVDFEIPLSEDHKQHLIITGKNGSGKTSVLRELNKFLNSIPEGSFLAFETVMKRIKETSDLGGQIASTDYADAEILRSLYNESREKIESANAEYGGCRVYFNKQSMQIHTAYGLGKFIVSFFEAKRNKVLRAPTSIQKIERKRVYGIEENAGEEFIQYIVNLKADRSFANDDKDNETVAKVDEWFQDFEENLFRLFDAKGVKLEFDRKSYNFNLIEAGKEPYNLNQLSDGYSAIFSIVTELIMRMEQHKVKSYDVQGVVLIDEIETHLHVDLQKKILPFLIAFFPKIQFIVTTHSPFVINSIENAVICDLEKRIVTTDLSGYSYDTLIESYFDSDKYSTVLKEHIDEYEQLLDNENRNEAENDRLFELKQYLKEIPKFTADELAVKLQQIKLKQLDKRRAK